MTLSAAEIWRSPDQTVISIPKGVVGSIRAWEDILVKHAFERSPDFLK